MSRTFKDIRGVSKRRGATLSRQRVRRAVDIRRTPPTFDRLCRGRRRREVSPSIRFREDTAI
jgi:hypothetical protein